MVSVFGHSSNDSLNFGVTDEEKSFMLSIILPCSAPLGGSEHVKLVRICVKRMIDLMDTIAMNDLICVMKYYDLHRDFA